VTGEIVETFGIRFHPLLNTRKQHTGMDFAAAVGQPLTAAAAGEIASAGNEGSPGIAILIRHQDGWETFYSHLSRLAVRAGDCVKRGDLIGYSGSTGFTVGRVLHFEVRHNGTPIDPSSLLAPVTRR
jgi:murein DD-endopeptidase MepM/ murein hydrolase activator NlpD